MGMETMLGREIGPTARRMTAWLRKASYSSMLQIDVVLSA